MSLTLDEDLFPKPPKDTSIPKASAPPFEPVQAKPQSSESYLPEVKMEVTSLPSMGKCYPKDAIIKYRTYSFGEVKKVNQEKLDEIETFDFVLKGVETNFDKESITMADALYLGMLRKISSLGSSIIVVRYRCRVCNSVVSNQIDMAKNPTEFEDLQASQLPIVLGADGNTPEMHFRPATIKDYRFLCKVKKHADPVALLAVQCSNLPFDQAYSIIDNASYEDGEEFNNIDDLLYHGVKPIALKGSCGHENLIELDGGQALIMPYRESKEHVKTRIRFGS